MEDSNKISKANSIDDLSKEELLELLKIYAKNWLAHDGCWFLSVEEKHGIDEAINIDRESWRKFTIVEAKRINEFLSLGKNSGIEGLARALRFRLYSTINKDKIEILDNKSMIYYVETCRVQEARRRKGLKDFPCKSVGIVEYSLFAKTIDGRIETECLSCPPEITDNNNYCIWKFTIKE
ncbi:MAG: hypothetical protein A2X61_16935 [Ignavibacteria bacterium GWB2_35_12]|nr:MAG: hypothetical protein A2X63_01960 [Ignavibacteria bacterium GWA2_35_8]OGU38036.1 MAG: hypothetical protein A2X61_16935 [Ignavibacteria bacterium GWB2_35_12]OGU87496.1 MAG: hypothetical protein A2220_17090 [Ignavibacteria bacterium RIFOXYA2_FULL_35_10]OGV25042.1 MAG: hypothetical protein A2475_16690 [Ignavibacteria bacterium RIFOXYC2_FULL_35_21]